MSLQNKILNLVNFVIILIKAIFVGILICFSYCYNKLFGIFLQSEKEEIEEETNSDKE
jgi:hypothetical protein